MPTDTIKWIEINLKVLDTINDNRSIIGSTEVADPLTWRNRLGHLMSPSVRKPSINPLGI
jgi:hypothetical protein